jgi:hypothetical protein
MILNKKLTKRSSPGETDIAQVVKEITISQKWSLGVPEGGLVPESGLAPWLEKHLGVGPGPPEAWMI